MRKGIAVITAVLVVLLIAAAFGADRYVRGLGPRARVRVISALSDRFDADVELKSLQLELLPRPSVSGDGLVIRHKGWPDQNPLIYVRHFSAHSDVVDLMWERDRVSEVTLQGLEIHVSHRGEPVAKVEPATEQPSAQPALKISIGKVTADGTILEIEPKEAGKDPLVFHIQKLALYSASASHPMNYVARVVNAKPPGLIDSTGSFGPWQKDAPRTTPLDGKYTFAGADLSVFKGIRGTLSSSGSYGGLLERIEVNGTTDTPDFALKSGGAPVRLTTKFHSIVNGTDGETVLDPVNAKFLSSEFVCNGGVVRVDGQTAKTVDLYATATQARMEDILQLIMGDKKPMLTGAVDFRSKIVIPPGQQPVLEKLSLNGTFKILAAQFTSSKVASRLDTLSDRARGITKKEEEDIPRQQVASNLMGTFRLDHGVAKFSSLSFQLPGAAIKLAGDYNLRSQGIDMGGVFRMNATIADTQSGIKHWLLKPLDPLFEKDGAGFQVPLKITGDRQHPVVSVEMFHHTFTMK